MNKITLTNIEVKKHLYLVKEIKQIYELGLLESKKFVDNLIIVKTLDLDLRSKQDVELYKIALDQEFFTCDGILEKEPLINVNNRDREKEADYWFLLLTDIEKEYINILKLKNKI